METIPGLVENDHVPGGCSQRDNRRAGLAGQADNAWLYLVFWASRAIHCKGDGMPVAGQRFNQAYDGLAPTPLVRAPHEMPEAHFAGNAGDELPFVAGADQDGRAVQRDGFK